MKSFACDAPCTTPGTRTRTMKWGGVARKAIGVAAALALTLGAPSAAEALAGDTADTLSPVGTTINVFDYEVNEPAANPNASAINRNHSLKFSNGAYGGGYTYNDQKFMNGWTGDQTYGSGGGLFENIVGKNLGEDGYPVLQSGHRMSSDAQDDSLSREESLSYLFDPSVEQEDRRSYENVTNLLAINDENYFEYNSDDYFASLNTDTKEFTVREVAKSWKNDSGYFPFNAMNGQGTGLADGQSKNFHFGTTMTTHFLQPAGGRHPSSGNDLTYEFSGDDDVWIFIDGKLVADLGGIHDAASVTINFRTGQIVRRYMVEGEERTERSTLKRELGLTGSSNTLQDDTLHTLKFFYLERGEGKSNMHLKFNLITVPESNIIKTDTENNPVPGARFDLYSADNAFVPQGEAIASGITNAAGEIVLTTNDTEDKLIYFEDLYNLHGWTHYVLKETAAPQGYRKSADMHLLYDVGTGAILSQNRWNTGAFAEGILTATIAAEPGSSIDDPYTFVGGSIDGKTSARQFMNENGALLDNRDQPTGRFFAMVQRFTGKPADENDLKTDSKWHAVYPSGDGSWRLAPNTSGYDGIIKAAKNGGAHVAELNTNGQYWIPEMGLPGNIEDYYYFVDANGGTGSDFSRVRWTVSFYFTADTSDDWSGLNANNTRRLARSDVFDRQFGASLKVTDMPNDLYIQKYDELGNPVSDVEFDIYASDDVNLPLPIIGGKPSIKEGAAPIGSVTTVDQLPVGNQKIDGAAVYPGEDQNNAPLVAGETYYLVERSVPDGYDRNESFVEIKVTDTETNADGSVTGGEVFANATAVGTNKGEDDGVSVVRGVGHLSPALAQFAHGLWADQVVGGEPVFADSTLHDIKAVMQTTDNDNLTGWANQEPEDTKKDPDYFHLTYGADNRVFDYGSKEAGGQIHGVTDDGWSKLDIRQCVGHKKPGQQYEELDKNLDLAPVFEGYTVVEFTNQTINDLEIAKTVDTDVAGLDISNIQANTAFEFELELQNPADPNDPDHNLGWLTGDYEIKIVENNADNDPIPGVDPIKIKQDQPTPFKLRHGQKALIEGLPVQVKFKVTEKADGLSAGFVVKHGLNGATPVESAVASGTLADSDTNVEGIQSTRVDYLNTYNAAPTTTTINFRKVMTSVGGTHNGGTFNFELLPQGDAPAPLDQNEKDPGEVSLELKSSDTNRDGTFTFANDAFKLPKVYTYWMVELQDEPNIPGIAYSQAFYTVEIGVVEENGALKVASTTIKKYFDDDGTRLDTPETLGSNEVPVFTNTYNKDAASYTFTGTKTVIMNGVKASPTPEFEFKLEPATQGAPMPAGSVNGVFTAKNMPNGSFIVGPFSFENADLNKSYEYKLTEVSTQAGGWQFDGSEYTVTLTPEIDSATGAMVVTSVYTKSGETAPVQNLTFENVYDAEDATATLQGTKVFNGRNMNADEELTFTAKLTSNNIDAVKVSQSGSETPLTADGVTVTVSDAKNGTAKDFTFPELKFSRAGEYTFEITEKAGADTSVRYDAHVATVTVTVTDDGNGTLTATVGAYDNKSARGDGNSYNNAAIDKADTAYFVNQYLANGSYSLEGIKTLEGRNFKEWETLTFKVEAVDGAPLPSGVKPDGTATFNTRTDRNTRKLTFGNIAFTEEHLDKGAFRYNISEVNPDGDKGGTFEGVTYDGQTYTLALTPKADPAQPGKIIIEEELTTDRGGAGSTVDEIAFTNVYVPQGSSAEGKVGGSKILQGRTLKADEFSFELVPDDTVPVKDSKTTAQLVDEQLIVMPNTVVKNKAPEDGQGSFEFGQITFKTPTDIGDANWFRFYIREVLPKADDGTELTEEDGIKYDNHDALVRFRVQDKTGNGVLTVDSSVQDPVFINRYDPTPTSVSLEATKVLDGRSLAEGEFEFELKDADGKVLQKKTNAADGKVKFDAISLTKEGEYTYTINEKIPDADKKNPSITYDEAVRTLTVKVTDNGAGALEHKFVVGDKEQDDQPEVKFTNTYKALPVSDTLTATKSVKDSDAGNAFVMKDGDFSFTLSKDDQVIETVSNKADGSITFKPLEFSAPGKYVYALTENDVDDTKAPGVSKDATVYAVTYVVSDEDEQGNNLDKLRIASKTVEKPDGTALGTDEPITFTNAYATGKTTYAINGTKTIVATDPLATKREPANDEFEFVLESVAGTLANGTTVDKANVPMPAGLEQDGTKVVKNGGSAFSFGDMTYTQTGTYEYLVTEKPGADPTIGYSQQQFKVVVTVVAAGEDPNTHEALLNATAAITLNDEPATSIAFENTYTPAPVTTAIPGGTKTLEGRDMKEGEFGFVLKNSAGEVVETVANAADGTFAFSALTFDKVGTYTYTVHEEHRGETLNGVRHDSAIYSITVTVKDDPATHALVAEVAAGLEGKPVKSLDFTNTYEAAPTDVVLNASKVLTGRDLKDGEFAFEALDAGGKKVSEATNTASGQVTFKSIRLDKPGTYTYKLREVAGSEKGMKYDGSEFTATVTVTDDGSGVLKAEIAYSADPVFKNVFTPEGGNGGNGGNPPSGGTGTTPPGGGSGTGDGDGKGGEILPATGDQSLAPMALAVMAAAGIALTAGGLALAKRRR